MTEGGASTAIDDDEAGSLAQELGLLDRTAAENLMRLRDGFLNLEKWGLLVGAAVSRAAGLPTWEELTRDLATTFGVDCPARPPENVYPSIIEECLNRAESPEMFWNALADAVCGGEPSELHELLLKLPCEVFLTTYFDCLFDRAHGEFVGTSLAGGLMGACTHQESAFRDRAPAGR